MRTVLALAGLVLAVVLLGGCGGGGASGAIPTGDATPFVADLSDHVVVRYDVDGDGLPDVLTLDPSTEPFRVVEALAGTADGGTVDATARLGGRAIDPAISEALATFLSSALAVDQDTDLQVVVGNETVDVTVMD